MTKTLPTGCKKQTFDTSWRTFSLLLQNGSLDDQIGHLYAVDIELDHTNATEKQLVYDEIYPPILKNKKLLIHGKIQYISCSNNTLQQKQEINGHIEQLKKLMQCYSKKISISLFRITLFLPLTEPVCLLLKYIHTTHLNKNALRTL